MKSLYIINSYFLIGAILVIGSGCNKGFLDIDPSDQYSVETFWKTEEHAKAGLTGCYRSLMPFGGAWVFETDMITPNAWKYNENGGVGPISISQHTSTTPVIENRWNTGYAGIGRTNTFLDKVQGVVMPEALKDRMIGEAKVLRAFYYSEMVNLYGGVPLILETPDAAKHADLPRATKEAVVAQILKDLDEAAAVLPKSFGGPDAGRVTKGTALALKARVLLYNERWGDAAEAAKQVMDLDAYSLFPNYRELFMLANEHNSEVIFNVEALAPKFVNNMDEPIYVLNTPAPLKDLVDAYLMNDGQPISTSPLFDPAHPYENRDPRLHQTIVVIGSKFNGKIVEHANVVNTGFGIKKYTSFSDEVNTTPTPTTSELNAILIRYAEVLLTYAEAQNEATGPDETVYAALNEIRGRPSVDMPDVEEGLSKEEMRAVIRNERRIELAFEGLYYSDIKRWKTAEIVNNGPILNYQGSVITNRTFDKDRDYLWPIPYVEIQKNPELEQNPNWN